MYELSLLRGSRCLALLVDLDLAVCKGALALEPEWLVGVDLPDDTLEPGLELFREEGLLLVGVAILDRFCFLLASSFALCSIT